MEERRQALAAKNAAVFRDLGGYPLPAGGGRGIPVRNRGVAGT